MIIRPSASVFPTRQRYPEPRRIDLLVYSRSSCQGVINFFLARKILTASWMAHGFGKKLWQVASGCAKLLWGYFAPSHYNLDFFPDFSGRKKCRKWCVWCGKWKLTEIWVGIRPLFSIHHNTLERLSSWLPFHFFRARIANGSTFQLCRTKGRVMRSLWSRLRARRYSPSWRHLFFIL